MILVIASFVIPFGAMLGFRKVLEEKSRRKRYSMH